MIVTPAPKHEDGVGEGEGVKEPGSGPKMIGGGAGSQALCTDNHNPSSSLLS